MKYILILLLLISLNTHSQDLLDGNKIWYSSYLHKKVNQRFYISDYTLMGFNGRAHSFSFFQNDIALNYRQNRFLSFVFMYSFSTYNWISSYKNTYKQPITFFNTINFNRLALGVNYDFHINKQLKLKQYLTFQFYIPRLEKYQARIKYDARLSYQLKESKHRIKPFIIQSYFYYLNGRPNLYYNADGSIDKYASPNGIHRSRTKLGISFRPLKNVKKLYLVPYFTIQKEFNIKNFGNDLNILQPSSLSSTLSPTRTVIPFNSYNIYGIQINYFL